jgi:hypothetical protein
MATFYKMDRANTRFATRAGDGAATEHGTVGANVVCAPRQFCKAHGQHYRLEERFVIATVAVANRPYRWRFGMTKVFALTSPAFLNGVRNLYSE